MYLGAIFGYLSWPFMILVSYLAVRWALKYFDRRQATEGNTKDESQ